MYDSIVQLRMLLQKQPGQKEKNHFKVSLVVVAFSSLARILEECSAIHYPLALFLCV